MLLPLGEAVLLLLGEAALLQLAEAGVNCELSGSNNASKYHMVPVHVHAHVLTYGHTQFDRFG